MVSTCCARAATASCPKHRGAHAHAYEVAYNHAPPRCQSPLITHKLTVLRDRNTPSATFRQLVDELVTLLAYEGDPARVAVSDTPIETPVAPTTGLTLSEPRPIVVPVLRAGLGMLEGMTRLLPTAEVGFLGMRRDDDTLEIETYANRLPDDLSGRQCFVLDPMLATGHTMVAATNYLFERGAKDVTCVCILAAPEGIKTLEDAIGERADVNVVVAAVDDHLNEKSYIVPRLGDAGDRLYRHHRLTDVLTSVTARGVKTRVRRS